MSLGSLSSPTNRVIDQDVSANTVTFIRPLWLMDSGETFEGLQSISTVPTLGAAVTNANSSTDGTSFTTGAWVPAANTLYLLIANNGVASGTTALNPSSITGNGTWTHVTGAGATSTVAAAGNVGVDVWWWYSSVAGASATTTINYASTQHSSLSYIVPVSNTYPGTVAVPPWSSTAVPYVQAVSASDSTAPASTTDTKTVTLTTLSTGQVVYFNARALGSGTQLAPASMTETVDSALDDITGSQGKIHIGSDYTTAPPFTSTTVGPATESTAQTVARAAVAVELIPAAWVNCMVSGIEVH
jgi:hypothetical protein